MSSSVVDIQSTMLAKVRDEFINAHLSMKLNLSVLNITDNDLIQYIIPFLDANLMITTLSDSDIRENTI